MTTTFPPPAPLTVLVQNMKALCSLGPWSRRPAKAWGDDSVQLSRVKSATTTAKSMCLGGPNLEDPSMTETQNLTGMKDFNTPCHFLFPKQGLYL